MEEKEKSKILKISFSISIIGILLIFFLINLKPEISEIEEVLDEKRIDGRVRISGDIISGRELAEDFYLITIKDKTGQIDVTLNKNISKSKVEVIGTVNKYEGRIQIQAEKITKI